MLMHLKYFSSIAAVKIGKKEVCTIICQQMMVHTFFLPIFTAAIDEKYFSPRSYRMTPNPRGDEMKREVPFICNDGHKSLNGRDQNATRVYHTHALTKCSNACQSNKISSKRGSLSQGQPTLCMYRARLLCYMQSI